MSESVTQLNAVDCVTLFEEQDFSLENTKITYDLNKRSSPIFFIEEPPEKEVGYYDSKKIMVVKGTPIIEAKGDDPVSIAYGKKVEEYNEIDGDTIKFHLDSLQDENTSFSVGNKTYKSLKEFAYNQNDESLRVRMLGIDAPEVVHYSVIPTYTSELNKYKVVKTYGQIKSDKQYVYTSKAYNDDDSITFYKNEDKYYEIINEDDDTYRHFTTSLGTIGNNISFVKIVSVNATIGKSQEYIDEGERAKKLAIDLLAKAKDIVLVLDHQTMNRKNSTLPSTYYDDIYLTENSVLKRLFVFISSRWNEMLGVKRYRYMGFNAPGLDNNGRFLGAIYIKCAMTEYGYTDSNPCWINLAKYIIYQCRDFVDSLPTYNNPLEEYHNNFVSSSFNLPTYDIDSLEVLDRFEKYTDDIINERNRLYETLTGQSIEFLKEYKLVIGDCIFMVPPLSIKLLSQTSHKRTYLMRAKGAAINSVPKSSKTLELDLYFNGEDGINGKPITQTLNGKKVTYYMNGLRSLLALFRLTPFLPIENTYINDALGIDAVTLSNIEISTVQNYPRTLRAILTLREFNYGIYMPEIQESDDVFTNAFSRTIHYPVMRWYYQKALQRGNEIKDMSFNSDEYIQATYGSNTSLIPMNFDNSGIEFYIPDETQLQKRLQAVKDLIPAVTQEDLTENMKSGLTECMRLKTAINNLLADSAFYAAADDIKAPIVVEMDEEITVSVNEWEPPIATNKPTLFPVVASTAYEGYSFYSIWPGSWTDNYPTMVAKLPLAFEEHGDPIYLFPRVLSYVSIPDKYIQMTLESVNTMCRLFQEHLGIFGNIEVYERIDASNITDQKIIWKVCVPLPQKLRNSEYEMNLLIKKVAYDFKLSNTDEVLSYNNEGILCVPIYFEIPLTSYTSMVKTTNDFDLEALGSDLCKIDGINFKHDTLGQQFIYYVENLVTGVDNVEDVGDDSLQLQRELLKEINDITLNDSLGLKFNKYEIGDAVIESIACSYSNTLSQTTLKAMDGYAFQYCGGQDIAIEINIITKDDLTVSMLSELPKYSAYFVRHYNLVLNCWPLRLNSELTRFFGVNEVLIESVQTSTVENQPGVTRIALRLFSVDRTTRARENIKKVENTENNSGSIAIGNEGKLNIKSFFDLNNTLSKIELYPDLELPTIAELKQNGFLIGKYNNDDRVYVDPDFYFIYAETLSSEVIKESIIKGLSDEGLNRETQYEVSDSNGALVKMRVPGLEDLLKDVKDIEYLNDIAHKESELYGEIAKVTYDYTQLRKEVLSQLSERSQVKYILSDTLAMLNTPMWNLSAKVKCPFRELEYTMLNNAKSTEAGKKLQVIIDEISNKIDAISSVGIDESMMRDEIANESNLSTMESLTDWAASEIKNTVSSYQQRVNFRYLIDLDKNNDSSVNHDILQKCILAVADACTGDASFCNTTINLQNVSSNNGVFRKINWQVRPYLNYGDNLYTLSDNTLKLDLENKLIPFCQTLKNDSESFATNIADAMTYGISFGVFQIKMHSREIISAYTGVDVNTMKENELYFIDPYYRDAQINGDYETINRYKRLLLTSPSFSTMAYIRQLLVLYKYLIDQDVLISMYEIACNEADAEIKSHSRADATQKDSPTSDEKGDTDAEELKEEILEEFYELVTLLVNYQQVDSDKRKTIISEVLQVEEKSKLGLAIKETLDQSVEEIYSNIEAFKDKCQKEMLDDSNSESKKQRYKTLYDVADSNQDVVAFAYEVSSLEASYLASVEISQGAYEAITKLVAENWKTVISGKVIALSLYLMDYEKIYTRVLQKNVTELNRIIATAAYPSFENEYQFVRKYLLALTGRSILDASTINASYDSAQSIYKNVINEKIDIDRSKDPKSYLRDACYDMIKNDHRGKMLRAYPTYYMLFVDEGREIGLWKLHDNFYSTNAICSLKVVKSRRIASDTAHIVMSNMFRNYTNPDYDMLYNMDTKTLSEIKYAVQDAWESLFSPRTYYEREELQRQNTPENIFNTKLAPGARVHIRMGYGADASSLPIVFNGMIAEIEEGELIEMIAQGDGAELTNTLSEDSSLEDIKNKADIPIGRGIDNWLTNGVTPKTALVSLLNSKGAWFHSTIRRMSRGRFFNYNPYGISHFGDPEFKAIFKNGETSQNIFEAYKDAIWTNAGATTSLASQYRTKDVPRISMYIEGKQFWDILHVCRSTCPDYICSIVPFQLRSSIFMGAGRYYYAFDYVREVNEISKEEVIKEKRKPFQQYHYYTSYTDIIENEITTDASRMKTVATGYYTETKLFGKEVSKKVGPLFVDYDKRFSKILSHFPEMEG